MLLEPASGAPAWRSEDVLVRLGPELVRPTCAPRPTPARSSSGRSARRRRGGDRRSSAGCASRLARAARGAGMGVAASGHAPAGALRRTRRCRPARATASCTPRCAASPAASRRSRCTCTSPCPTPSAALRALNAHARAPAAAARRWRRTRRSCAAATAGWPRRARRSSRRSRAPGCRARSRLCELRRGHRRARAHGRDPGADVRLVGRAAATALRHARGAGDGRPVAGAATPRRWRRSSSAWSGWRRWRALPSPSWWPRTEVLDENRFLAARDGIDADLIDPLGGAGSPVGARSTRCWRRAGRTREALGCKRELELVGGLAGDPGPARQRRRPRAEGPAGADAHARRPSSLGGRPARRSPRPARRDVPSSGPQLLRRRRPAPCARPQGARGPAQADVEDEEGGEQDHSPTPSRVGSVLMSQSCAQRGSRRYDPRSEPSRAGFDPRSRRCDDRSMPDDVAAPPRRRPRRARARPRDRGRARVLRVHAGVARRRRRRRRRAHRGLRAGPRRPSGSTRAGATSCPGFIDAHVHIESSKLMVERVRARAARARHDDRRRRPARDRERARRATACDWFLDACDGRAARRLRDGAVVRAREPASSRRAGRSAPTRWSELLTHPRRARDRRDDELPGRRRRRRRASSPSSRSRDAGHVDGHAPGLVGARSTPTSRPASAPTTRRRRARRRSRSAARGAWVLIREASNARNLRGAARRSCARYGPERCAFCTDDREPDMLLREGHIDQMCRARRRRRARGRGRAADGVAPPGALPRADRPRRDRAGLQRRPRPARRTSSRFAAVARAQGRRAVVEPTAAAVPIAPVPVLAARAVSVAPVGRAETCACPRAGGARARDRDRCPSSC